MSKVKLTKKQAVIIESLKEEHLEMLKELYEHPENYDIGKLEPLMDLTAEQYHEALYVGYEVEKEYKAGDFVVHKDGHTGLIDNVHTNNPQGEKVFEGAWFDGNDFMLMLTDENNFERRANEEEIVKTEDRKSVV